MSFEVGRIAHQAAERFTGTGAMTSENRSFIVKALKIVLLVMILVMAACVKPPGPPNGAPNGGCDWVYTFVDIKLDGDRAIEWMKDNGYDTVSPGLIIRGKSMMSISAGAFYSGKLYDKNNQIVGSLISTGDKISIHINRQGSIRAKK